MLSRADFDASNSGAAREARLEEEYNALLRYFNSEMKRPDVCSGKRQFVPLLLYENMDPTVQQRFCDELTRLGWTFYRNKDDYVNANLSETDLEELRRECRSIWSVVTGECERFSRMFAVRMH